jgi:hypothetical protein
MQAILAVFRGEAMLGNAPVQVIEPGSDTTEAPPTAQPPTTDSTDDPAVDPGTTGTVVEPAPATTLPSVQADENEFGIVPDKNVSC